MPVKWSFPSCVMAMHRRARHPLDSDSATHAGLRCAAWNPDSHIEKKICECRRERSPNRRRTGTLRTEAGRFANQRSVSFLLPKSPRTHRRASLKFPVRVARTSLLSRGKAAGTDCVCLMIARLLAHAVRRKNGRCGATRPAALPRGAISAGAMLLCAKGQMPSFTLSRSFTAWGLALPPDAFIT
jgi:hypothetical protein